MCAEVYLGLGSNLGDRASNIARGLQMLEDSSSRVAASSLYETSPQGYADQPPFLNAACRIRTTLEPFELLAELNRIEAALGRRRSFPNAPRELDIDILLWGETVLDTPTLTVPHPRMAERAFVLVPLAEIAPGLTHPVLADTIEEMLQRLDVGEDTVTRWGDVKVLSPKAIRVKQRKKEAN